MTQRKDGEALAVALRLSDALGCVTSASFGAALGVSLDQASARLSAYAARGWLMRPSRGVYVRAPHAVRSVAARVLEAVVGVSEPVGAARLAAALNEPHGAVRAALCRLQTRGQVRRAGRGVYEAVSP